MGPGGVDGPVVVPVLVVITVVVVVVVVVVVDVVVVVVPVGVVPVVDGRPPVGAEVRRWPCRTTTTCAGIVRIGMWTAQAAITFKPLPEQKAAAALGPANARSRSGFSFSRAQRAAGTVMSASRFARSHAVADESHCYDAVTVHDVCL
ncbi:MAG TPA: hypothetical protein VMU39_15950 [Solirubrobacteraceae bacterium]|nr:hypothetical protein [Solirubrobacteraceae bacterium]